jgi:hypothetical protein
MKSNLKVMLPTLGVAALLVSPAMATSASRHHNTIYHYTAPARGYLPGGPYGYTPPNQPTTGPYWQGEPTDRLPIWRYGYYQGNDPDQFIRSQMMRDPVYGPWR